MDITPRPAMDGDRSVFDALETPRRLRPVREIAGAVGGISGISGIIMRNSQ